MREAPADWECLAREMCKAVHAASSTGVRCLIEARLCGHAFVMSLWLCVWICARVRTRAVRAWAPRTGVDS